MARSSSRRGSKYDNSQSRSRSTSQSSSSSSSSSSDSSSSQSSSSQDSYSSSSSTSSSSSSASSRSRASSRTEHRARSKSPATKIIIGRLTKNVNKSHIIEIFKSYGQIRNVELPYDKWQNPSKCSAFVEFEKNSDADKAIKFMDGGQIDGQVITVSKCSLSNSGISSNSNSKPTSSTMKPRTPPLSTRNNGSWRRIN